MKEPHTEQQDVKRQIEELKERVRSIIREREFLLGEAIPKLEHEYLYCISLLEREASVIQSEVQVLQRTIQYYENVLKEKKEPDPQQMEVLRKMVLAEFDPIIAKHSYKHSEAPPVFPSIAFEREEISRMMKVIMKLLSSSSTARIHDASTDLFRRLTKAYREGNVGELRALRLIIEAKSIDKSRKGNGTSVSGWIRSRALLIGNYVTGLFSSRHDENKE